MILTDSTFNRNPNQEGPRNRRSMMKWFIASLKKYAVFQGRARRTEYWMFVLFSFIILVIANILDHILGLAIEGLSYGPIYIIFTLALLLPSLSLSARRLHDIGKSGWFILVNLIPIGGFIWYLVLVCSKGNKGANAFGDDPIASSALVTSSVERKWKCPKCATENTSEYRKCSKCHSLKPILNPVIKLVGIIVIAVFAVMFLFNIILLFASAQNVAIHFPNYRGSSFLGIGAFAMRNGGYESTTIAINLVFFGLRTQMGEAGIRIHFSVLPIVNYALLMTGHGGLIYDMLNQIGVDVGLLGA
jgi:uncharacterized membrane protein YhaH (DUF805 family)